MSREYYLLKTNNTITGAKMYSQKIRPRKLKIVSILVAVLCVILLGVWYSHTSTLIALNLDGEDGWSPDHRQYNVTGWSTDIVPDVVHYILFEYHRISYSNMLSLMSVVRIHQPEVIYIHCDCDAIESDDLNWARVLAAANATGKTTIHVNRIVKPTEINGMKIRDEYRNFHASDITRYRLLSRYGGIYVDNDVFVCQPLHWFRKFEFTLNWDEGQFMGSQVLIGHKDARFLRLVLQSYEAYDTNQWYYNAGMLPTIVILEKYPYVVHRIKVKFGVDAPVACQYFYKEWHRSWNSYYYTFHMVMRGNRIQHKDWCLGDADHWLKHVEFNDEIIRKLNNTFGQMARAVMWPEEYTRLE